MDGRLVAQGRRLVEMEAGEMLSWVYFLLTESLDPKDRMRFDRALLPMRTQVINDPMLPESMQGLRPPSWWTDD